MKILLTGATGFLGYRTLRQLVNEDEVEHVIASGRHLKDTHTVEHLKIEYRLGDLAESQFVHDLVRDVDVIIHAAALSSPWGRFEEFKRSNVDAQRHLIRCANQYNVRKFIFISSPSVYFNGKDRLGIKETDPLPSTFTNAYAATKREAEVVLESGGIPFVILRPRALIGAGDTVIMPRLVRAYDEGRLRVIGDGENMADLTSVANVVDAILLSVKAEGKQLNETYNISNGAPVKLWSAISNVLTKLDRTPPQKKVPYQLVNFIARLSEIRSSLTNMKEPVLTRYGVGTLARSMTLDISKAKNLLGYKPQMSTEEAIDEFVSWYRQQ